VIVTIRKSEEQPNEAAMTDWDEQELALIADTEEISIAGRRTDDTLRKPVTIWVARLGDDLYVRSVRGREAAWFKGTQLLRQGHVSAGGLEMDVAFEDAGGPGVDDELDAVYRAKYGHYPERIVGSVVTPQAREATLRLQPLDSY
jgi:hypothetical protein